MASAWIVVGALACSSGAPAVSGAPDGEECLTRAPIPYEQNPYNYLLDMVGGDDGGPTAFFREYLRTLSLNPPEVMQGSGGQWVGLVPFDWGFHGAILGNLDPVLGDWTQGAADPCEGHRLLPPDLLRERIEILRQYVKRVHAAGAKQVMPYIDFGTQLFGRHTRPAEIDDPCRTCDGCPDPCPPVVPESVWAFWEFYDHWDDYAAEFDIGPKPPDPTTWLRKLWDPARNDEDVPAGIEGLEGLSFDYAPKKCNNYGPHYRYSVCVNTEGWRIWWKQVVQWAARTGYDGVFVDNAFFSRCWNDECQAGYRAWLAENFSDDEIRRYFTTKARAADNLVYDASFEAWHKLEGSDRWRTSYWGAEDSGAPIEPDTDAVDGAFSCRVDVDGTSHARVHQGTSGRTIPVAEDVVLSFSYKTRGSVDAGVVLVRALTGNVAQPVSLTQREGWTRWSLTLPAEAGRSEQNAEFVLWFEAAGAGTLWLDDVWLLPGTDGPVRAVELEPGLSDPSRVRWWAAGKYWNDVTDEKLGYLRDAGRRVNPHFQIFANSYSGDFVAANADYYLREVNVVPELDAYRRDAKEDVGYPPGLFSSVSPPADPVLVSNAFGLKYSHGLLRPGGFSYVIPTYELAPGPGRPSLHNPDSALLNLAEGAAFGGGAGIDAASLRARYGHYVDGQGYTTAELDEIRLLIRRFWEFIQRDRRLYEGYRTYADIGIVFHDLFDHAPEGVAPAFLAITDMAKDLAAHGVLWDVLPETRANAVNFDRLRALVYHDVERMSEAEAREVWRFMERGGLVLASGIVGNDDEWFRMRVPDPGRLWPPVGKAPATTDPRIRALPEAFETPVGAGALVYRPDPWTAAAVIARVEGHIGRTVRLFGDIEPAVLDRLRLNAWILPRDATRIVLHVLNYNVVLGKGAGLVAPVEHLSVRVPLPEGAIAVSVKLHSPEIRPMQTGEIPFDARQEGWVSFRIPRLRVYTVVSIEARVVPRKGR